MWQCGVNEHAVRAVLSKALSCSFISPLKCLQIQNLRLFGIKAPPKNPRQSLFDCWSKYVVSLWDNKAVHCKKLHNTPYASTQAARVTAADRHNLLFKLLSCKHAMSLWLCLLSSHLRSDCCGEVLLREYTPLPHHPPNTLAASHLFLSV